MTHAALKTIDSFLTQGYEIEIMSYPCGLNGVVKISLRAAFGPAVFVDSRGRWWPYGEVDRKRSADELPAPAGF